MPEKPEVPTLEDALMELRREVKMRMRVYPNWISSGRITKEAAERQNARLQKAIDLLQGLRPKTIDIFAQVDPDLNHA